MALLKILLVLAGLIGLLKVKCPLGLALVAAAVGIGFLFGAPAGEIARVSWVEASRLPTLDLAATLVAIVVLSDLMQRSGQFRRISDAAGGMFRDPRVALAALPTLIGLLPMPGGALFSAPLVEALANGKGPPGGGDKLGAERKALINYWFRHVWEYSWPLYPGVILAASLSHIHVNFLCLTMLPLSIVAVLAGVVFILRDTKVRANALEGNRLAAAGRFLVCFSPILLVIGLFLGLRVPLAVCVLTGVVIVLAIGTLGKTLSVREAGRAFFGNRETYQVVLLAFAVMVFGGIIRSCGAVGQTTADLARYGFPAMGVAILLPFVVGLMTGITIGYVGATFPIVLALSGTGPEALPTVILAFVSGFLGTLLSPAHLCLTSTNQYFKANSLLVYRAMTVPLVFLFATGVSLFVLYGARGM